MASGSYDYLESRKFCVVFVKVVDPARQRIQLQCFRGRATIERGRINVVSRDGCVFTVPGSAMGNVLPNDGTQLLRDAEYFAFVRTDDSLDLSAFPMDGMEYSPN